MAKPKKRINQNLAKPRKNTNAKWFILGGVAVVLIIIVGVVLYSRAGTGSYAYDPVTKKPSGRPYSPNSPLNQTIPSDVQYQSDSNTRISTISGGANIGLITWALPIYDADTSTPKSTVFCRLYSSFDNGFASLCPEITKQPVPIPLNPVPEIGGDNHLLVIDSSSRKAYDYWGWKDCSLPIVINFVNANWCPLTGNSANIDGNGTGSGGIASQIAPTGGVIRTYEVEEGSIEHALIMTVPNTCFDGPLADQAKLNKTTYINKQFVYPATATDGGYNDQGQMLGSPNQTTCMKMGWRVQIDPSIDLNKISFQSKFEKMIAVALQKYGAYVSDTNNGAMSYYAEYDRTGRNVYQNAGVPAGTDGYLLKNIPWANAKIITPQWNSDGTKAYSWGGILGGGTVPAISPSSSTAPAPSASTISTAPPPTTTTNPPAPTTSAPTPPTNLIATGIFDTQIILGWGASSNSPVGYKIYKDGAVYATVPASNLGYTVQYLAPQKTYKFEVAAYNNEGKESAKSNAATVTTKAGCFLFFCW